MIQVAKKFDFIINAFGPDIPEGSEFETAFLNADGETYTVTGVRKWGNCPFIISQLQGKLMLDLMGLYGQVEEMINQSGTQEKIYWNTAQNWERTSPILNRLAPMIWTQNTDQMLDEFFIEASKLS
jgi:hypothetical protein